MSARDERVLTTVFLAVGVGCLYAAAHAFRGAPETLRRSEKTEKTQEDDASVCHDEARETNAPGASSSDSVEKEDAEKAEKPSAFVSRVAISSPPPE